MVPAPQEDEARAPVRDMRVIQLVRRARFARDAPAILIDDAPALRDAVRHLVATGHRRIAHLGAEPRLSSGRARLAAFRAGMAGAGLGVDETLTRTVRPLLALAHAETRRLLDAGQATALVCGGVELSNGALWALMDAGLMPSGAFGFVGYGDPSFCAWIGGG